MTKMKTITLAKLYVAKLSVDELDVMQKYIGQRRNVLRQREITQRIERNWKLIGKRHGTFITDKNEVIEIFPPGRHGGAFFISTALGAHLHRAWSWLSTVTLVERLPDHPLRRDLRLSQLKVPPEKMP